MDKERERERERERESERERDSDRVFEGEFKRRGGIIIIKNKKGGPLEQLAVMIVLGRVKVAGGDGQADTQG